MQKNMKVTYLYNSGFLVELSNCALIFDYYLDKKECVTSILPNYDKIYFFVSHSHFDHWNSDISKFSAETEKYFLSYDIHKTGSLPKGKIVFLNEYDAYEDSNISVHSYSSTDAGISFLVEVDDWKIFHAGDFNWWNWKGDTKQNNAFAKNGFFKQMKKIAGLEADIAFFPVDTRLEECCDWGVKKFCEQTYIQNLVTMHNAGRHPWKLDLRNISMNKEITVWSPQETGETKILGKQGD
ncbi:MBL fold metallo-hydrolase [Pectinatus sottacetonis]|uniref:MBL fold metallo-hydrolase n=1 Tax=Pectinatus sottacetonis TaxID=1002795 RepID=UPI0018C4C23C|nr:MBL fold metallo-hydrolase [Pectinatus sottacetonis]